MGQMLKYILRDAVDMAKETGVWQLLTLDEKKDFVKYFVSRCGSKLYGEDRAA